MAAIAYIASITLGAFIMLKFLGLHAGVQPPANFQPPIGTGGMVLLAEAILFVPPAVATFVGAMTAPYAQRGLAAVVFPVLVFASITVMTTTGPHFHGLHITTLLETALSCAVPGTLVYILLHRQRSRSVGT